MTPDTKTVLAIDERLLEVACAEESPFDAISTSLASLAAALGVHRVVVAIDDPRCGRQVFSSDPRPLGPWPVGLTGPPRLLTDLPLRIPRRAEAALLASVQAAFTRSRQPQAPVGTTPSALTPVDQLARPVYAAVARARRYGWGFTLVCIALGPSDDGAGSPTRISPVDLGAALRTGDSVIDLGPGRVGLLLEGTHDEEIPPILARLARNAELPPFSFGLVHCPGDGLDAQALIDTALGRLVDARATTAAVPTIRAVGSRRR